MSQAFVVPQRELGVHTRDFLRANQLTEHQGALAVIVRKTSPVMYYTDVAQLGIQEEFLEGLIAAMGADCPV